MFWSTFTASGAYHWLIIAGSLFLALMTVRAFAMAERIPEDHPDTLGSMDRRERGIPAFVDLREWEAHQAAMTARAERLGYER